MNKILLLSIFLSVFSEITAQIQIRLFADRSPHSVLFTVTGGEYRLRTFTGSDIILSDGNYVFISKYEKQLAIKAGNNAGTVCDSVQLIPEVECGFFSLRINDKPATRRNYEGALKCYPDLSTIVMVNTTDEEKYLAGVVLSEGGRGQQPEFCKVQVVIARTYMYRYFNRHAADHYNLCDNTHCQAYNGLTDDSGIFKAISETSGEVITGPDSSLIISAFHSNCGGETAPSGSVWVSQEPYLVKINDPYCINSRNAVWEKSISLDEWTRYLRKSGYDGSVNDVLLLNISQKTRMDNLSFGNISIPVRQIRADFRLRSTFFSVLTDGDTVKFSGRGYGHGVGLCQEGAMEMASRGLEYKQIIKFYYSGVTIGSVSGFRTGMK